MNGDPRALARLVANLLDNAVRHAVSKVDVSLAEEGNEVVLRVDDDGGGIAEPDRERIFDRFVRLDEARDRDSGGSGLGLAIVTEVASRHGADVDIGVSPTGGARLQVRFPRSDLAAFRFPSASLDDDRYVRDSKGGPMDKNRKIAIGIAAAVAVIGGAGLGFAAATDDDEPLTGATLERATDAALEHTGGGTVVETEAGDDDAAYGVEIRMDDGSEVEVELDEDFNVIGTEQDDDGPGDDDSGEDD